MSKNKIREIVILGLLLIVFSLIAFTAPFKMNAVFWIAYAFGIIAIALQVYVFYVAFANGESAKSKFYGFPIARLGVVYLIIQLIVSIAEMAAAKYVPTWGAVIINIVILAVVLIGVIAAETMKEEIERQDDRLKKDVANMRLLQSKATSMVGLCQTEKMKATAQKLADDFKYSDPVSSDETMEIEGELIEQMKEIQKAIVEDDSEAVEQLSVRIRASLDERNRICKLNK